MEHPRDVEIAARCCRVWKDKNTPEPAAISLAHQVIQVEPESTCNLRMGKHGQLL